MLTSGRYRISRILGSKNDRGAVLRIIIRGAADSSSKSPACSPLMSRTPRELANHRPQRPRLLVPRERPAELRVLGRSWRSVLAMAGNGGLLSQPRPFQRAMWAVLCQAFSYHRRIALRFPHPQDQRASKAASNAFVGEEPALEGPWGLTGWTRVQNGFNAHRAQADPAYRRGPGVQLLPTPPPPQPGVAT